MLELHVIVMFWLLIINLVALVPAVIIPLPKNDIIVTPSLESLLKVA